MRENQPATQHRESDMAMQIRHQQPQHGRIEHRPGKGQSQRALYSIKWFSHPQATEAQQRLEFYLELLVQTGELKKVHALRAIEAHEAQERKHTENVKIQSRAFWVLVAVAALTVVQAGLIKLPPFPDFSPKKAAKTHNA